MYRILILFVICNNLLLFAQSNKLYVSEVWVADNGDGTYKNPIIYADYSDPDVVRVDGDYYMTASSFNVVPSEMEPLEIDSGLYAVFKYKGNQSNAANFYRKIYTEWFPSSKYELENRPQFEILGDKYKRNDPNSEEQIWIPIKRKV